MNIQHSSMSNEWGTPQVILDRARRVLGDIDFDPASSDLFNSRVRAKSYMTDVDDALSNPWSTGGTIFCNPPGGKVGNRSQMDLFWERLMDYHARRSFSHAIFLAFSLEALQVTQKCATPMASFTMCVPRRRIAFESPEGRPGKAPSHSNVIVYVPCTVNMTMTFCNAFIDIGAILNGDRP